MTTSPPSRRWFAVAVSQKQLFARECADRADAVTHVRGREGERYVVESFSAREAVFDAVNGRGQHV